MKIRSWATKDLHETPRMQAKIQVSRGDSRVQHLTVLPDMGATKSVIGGLLAEKLEVKMTKPKRRYKVTNASNDPMIIVGQANI